MEDQKALLGILNCFNEPAILVSRDYQILLANDAYRAHYGFSDRLTHKRHCYRISHHYTVPCDLAGETCPLKESLESREITSVVHVHHTPLGEEYVNVEMWPVEDPETGEVLFFIERMKPMTVATTNSGSGAPLVGRSRAFKEMTALITRVAPSDTNVMLLGESGTGKTLAAQAVHQASKRSDQPFVKLECTGLSDNEFEQELFGSREAPGCVSAAHGGTLLIDEVADLPVGSQHKLLRLLETRRYRRKDDDEWKEADFRLVCTSNKDLQQMARSGSLREDLFYRISVFEIHVPPLRERTDDLPLLIDAILERRGKKGLAVDSGALQALSGYDFPGNVRELTNIIDRAILLTDDETIRLTHLPATCQTDSTTFRDTDDIVPLAEAERRYLQMALARHRGDRRSLAKRLGLSERALYRKLATLRDS